MVDDALAGEARIGSKRNRLRFVSGSTHDILNIYHNRMSVHKLDPNAVLEISAGGTTDGLLTISSDLSSQGNVMTVTNGGRLGINSATPQTALDVNGFLKLRVYEEPPTVCEVGNDGAIALSGVYRICVCRSGAGGWVLATDGLTACTWL